MPESRVYLIYYDEISLKRGHRQFFEERLLRNIQHACRGLGVGSVKRLYGRIQLVQSADADPAALAARLRRTFGIAHFEQARVFDLELEPVREALAASATAGGFDSFALRTKRVNKQFPLRSQEINVKLGALVGKLSGARVDLGNPEKIFDLLILNKQIYLSESRQEGPRGLPVGTAGRVAHLLSGGIDSPVAAERLLKRGCRLVFVHFHSAPYTDRSSQEKAVELAQILCRDRYSAKVLLVPLGELQQQIVAEAPAPLRVLLYRRYMLRLSAALARRNKCRALGTGESIGQVASQTLDNLALLDGTVTLPVLRPLITYDKEEIVAEARRIGTFELSIEPDADCCGFLLPPKPAVHGRLRDVEAAEAALDTYDVTGRILKATETRWVGE